MDASRETAAHPQHKPSAPLRAAYSNDRGMDGGFLDEAGAIRIALEGSRGKRLATGARALTRLVWNPDDTTQVFLLGIVLNAPMFPALLAKILESAEGAALCEERPLIDSTAVDYAALRRLPASTLGGAYVRYLDDNHLDPDLFKPPPTLPEVPRWIVTRVRQTHDVWHALTGYGPDVRGELVLQAFTYGQLGMPSALMVALFGTLFRKPAAAADVWRGYRRGKAAAFLPLVRFESMWARPLADVQRELGIAPH